MVVFPHMMAPFIVGRDNSVRALERSLQEPEKGIFLVSQKDPKIDEPARQDMHEIGVIARVVQNLKLPNGNVKVVVEGVERAKLLELQEVEGALLAEVEAYEIEFPIDEKLELYINKVLGVFEQYAKMSHHLAFEGLVSTIKLDDVDQFTDQLAAHLMVSTAEKQSLLELLNPYERLQRLHDLLDVEVEKVNIDKRINVQVKKQMERAQKEYYLNEKIKAIHQDARTTRATRSRSSRSASKRRGSPRKRAKRRIRSSSGSRRCRRSRPKARSHGTTSTGWSACPGRRRAGRSGI
jgi:ATP-dependent Lon protease